jgi:NAD(P)H dehydrogenase (quinone)
MKHAVIIAHPKEASLTAAAAAAYADEARKLGHEAVVRDLYRMGFDPCLKAGEIPTEEGARFESDVIAERRELADVDVFCFVYPLWFNAPPAILKGYIDRVFGMGFGFAPAIGGGGEPLLDGRRLISFSFSGAPEHWVRETGALQALTTLFDRHVAGVCGLRVLDHVHTGGVVPNMTEDAVGLVLADVRKAVRANFQDAALG